MKPVQSEPLSSSYFDQVPSIMGPSLAEAPIWEDVLSTMNNALTTLENREQISPMQPIFQQQVVFPSNQRSKSQRRKDRRFQKKQQEEIQALLREHRIELNQLRQRHVEERKQRLEQRERYRVDQQQTLTALEAQRTYDAQIKTTANTMSTRNDIDESVETAAKKRRLLVGSPQH